MTGELASLSAVQEISDNLSRHSRGVDRNDCTLLGSAYTADGTVTYGVVVGSAQDFAVGLTGAMAGAPTTLHRTSNKWIRLDGADAARSESYVIAYLKTPEGDAGTQRLVGGRYLDRHVRTAAGWRIAHRTYVMDWNVNIASREPPPIGDGLRGRQGAADPAEQMYAAFRAEMPRETETMTTDTQALDEALVRVALHDLRCAYARGVDRCDAATLGAIFHPDAVVEGPFGGPADAFVAAVTSYCRDHLAMTAHTVANEYDEIRGDVAVGESYVLAYSATGDGAPTETLTGGRYLDRYERRGGVWKIALRRFVEDWSMKQPGTHREDGMYEGLPLHGARHPEDPVYAFWNGAPG